MTHHNLFLHLIMQTAFENPEYFFATMGNRANARVFLEELLEVCDQECETQRPYTISELSIHPTVFGSERPVMLVSFPEEAAKEGEIVSLGAVLSSAPDYEQFQWREEACTHLYVILKREEGYALERWNQDYDPQGVCLNVINDTSTIMDVIDTL